MHKHRFERAKPFVRIGTIGHIGSGHSTLAASAVAAAKREAHAAAMRGVAKQMEPEHRVDTELSARQQRKSRKAAKRAAAKEGAQNKPPAT